MNTPNTEFQDPSLLSSDAVQILNREDLVRRLVERGYDPELAREFASDALAPGETLPVIQTSAPTPMIKEVVPDAVETSSEGGGMVFENTRQARLAMSKEDIIAGLERRLREPSPQVFANVIEHAQDVANRTGKTVLTMKQLKNETFEGKVTSADVTVGKDRLATVEGPKSVLLVRCSPELRANIGKEVQVKSSARGATVRRPSKDLER